MKPRHSVAGVLFLWVWADSRGLCISLYQEVLYDNAVSYNRPLA